MSNLPALAIAEKDLIETLGNSLYPGADHNSIRMVISYCKASELDPMQKPVHIVPIWDSKLGRMRDVVMPGIGLYRTQAARSGQYAGVSEPEFGPDVTENIGGTSITFPSWCKVAVKRALPNGQIVEFFATERWKENYAAKGGKEKSIAPNAMWTKRPYGQLAKCAEAQALRKAFPEFGSQPTAEEMEGKEVYDERSVKQMGPADVVSSQTSDTYAPFEADVLPFLRDAAVDGMAALQAAFASVPACNDKTQLWKNHSQALKEAAESADKAIESATPDGEAA